VDSAGSGVAGQLSIRQEVTVSDVRVGLIGCDTSHVGAFTEIFHNPHHAHHVPGVKVVVCWPTFSPDIRSSAERVRKFKNALVKNYGVEMVDGAEALLERVDAVMIESVDGRRHLKEFEAVAPAGKPVFIDKPFTASLADAKKIAALAEEHNVPAWSSSSLRFDSGIRQVVDEATSCGKVMGCDAFSPAHLEKSNPGLYWYGIHGVEILFTIMGRGCEVVRCTSTEGGDMAVGVWKDGRIGTLRGLREGKAGYGARVMCEKKAPELHTAKGDYYGAMMKAMVAFFKDKKPPVPLAETVEICAFIEAAWESSKKNGDDVKLDL
jgi:hypothetical protein